MVSFIWPQSCPALADISQLLLQHHYRIAGAHEDMDCMLMTYFRHLILRVATPENQMPCPSLMTQEQRLLRWSVGNLTRVIKFFFSPWSSRFPETWNFLPPPGRKHWFLAGLHWSLVHFHTTACWQKTQKFRHSSDRLSSHSCPAFAQQCGGRSPNPGRGDLKSEPYFRLRASTPSKSHFPGSTWLYRLPTRRECSLS